MEYLRAEQPDIARQLADGVRLVLRTDLLNPPFAFSHHDRLDGPAEWRLRYRGEPNWDRTRDNLEAELDQHRQVLAVANTRYLAWSPHHGATALPHWVLLRERRHDRWWVEDHFSALGPVGEQHPHHGWLTSHQLEHALMPVPQPPPEVVNRDRYALGIPCELPPESHYRWLIRTSSDDPMPDPHGTWSHDTAHTLRLLIEILDRDDANLTSCIEDLWAAGRHHQHRYRHLADTGRLSPDTADAACRAWLELPRSLRFAHQSATRGRPRPTLINRTLTHLADTVETAEEEIR